MGNSTTLLKSIRRGARRTVVGSIVFVAISIFGCRDSSPTVEPIEPTAPVVSPAPLVDVVDSVARQASHVQSYTTSSSTLLTRRAYRDVLPAEADGRHWLGVDIELQPHEGATPAFELRQIELCNGANLHPIAAVVRQQRLTDDLRPADDADPIVATQRNYRCLLLYQAAKLPATVALRLGDSLITPTPLVVHPAPFTLPQPSFKPMGWRTRETSNPRYRSCLVMVECRHWSRVATPKDFKLRCLVGQTGETGDLEAYLETGPVIPPALDDRSLYVDRRWFLLDFWYPASAIVVDLALNGSQTQRLPPPPALDVSADTLRRLDEAPRFEFARHRRDD